mgnify:CR=1 FL=1
MKKLKGEALTITLAVIAVAFLIGTFIPQINPLNWFKSAAKPNTETRAYDTKDVIVTPFIAINEVSGKTIVANKVEEHYSKGNESFTPKQTLAQKFFGFLVGLGGWGVVLVGLAIAFPAAAAIVFARLRHVWRNAFKNTVEGVRSIKDKIVICKKCGDTVTIDAYEHVATAIETKQDKRDKVLVDKIKMQLH